MMKILIIAITVFFANSFASANVMQCASLFPSSIRVEIENREFIAQFQFDPEASLKETPLNSGNLRVMSFEDIPESYRPPQHTSEASGFDPEIMIGTSFLIRKSDPLILAENRRFRARHGEVELTNIFVSPRSRAELLKGTFVYSDLQDAPSVLGFLKSGQPVLVTLLSENRETIFARTSDHERLVGNRWIESSLRIGGVFYGIQNFAKGLYGVVSALPPRGLPLANGGERFIREATLIEAVRLYEKLAAQNLAAHRLQWALYVSSDGHLQGFPTIMSTHLRPSDPQSAEIYALSLELRGLGFEINPSRILSSRNQKLIALQLVDLLEGAAKADPSFVLINHFYTWLQTLRPDYYKVLLSEAIRDLQRDASRKKEIGTRQENRRYPWAFALEQHSLKRGLSSADAPGIIVLQASGVFNPITDYKNLAPNDMVTMKVSAKHELEWAASADIPSGIQVVAELIRIELLKDYKRQYHFRMLWRSDQGFVKKEFYLSTEEIQKFTSVAFEKSLLENLLRPLEEKRLKPSTADQVLVLDNLATPEQIQAVVDQSKKHGQNLNFDRDQLKALPSHIEAVNLTRTHFGEAFSKYDIYQTPDQTRLLMVAPSGEIIIREANGLDQVLFQMPASKYSKHPRKIIQVGSRYFITASEQVDTSTIFAIHRIEDGREVAKYESSRIVSLAVSTNQHRIYFMWLDFIETMQMPDGTIIDGAYEPQSRGLYSTLSKIKLELSNKANSSVFFSALHLSRDGQYAYVGFDTFTNPNVLAVIRLSDFEVLDLVNTGLWRANEIYSSDDNQQVVILGERKGAKGPVPAQVVFKRSESRK